MSVTTKKVSASTKKEAQSIEVVKIERGVMDFCVLGTTGMYCNKVSEKAKRELLFPKGPKTAADKAANMKHDPDAEFRDSPYLSDDPKGPTFILQVASCFKGAIKSAALDMPGSATKAQVGRLTFVEGDTGSGNYISIYGKPYLRMDIVRMADPGRTPDIRTRAYLPEWACRLRVKYIKPMLREQVVANLLGGSGVVCGVGDYRTQKGAGNFGEFELVSADDPRFEAIVKGQGRKVQIAAMQEAKPYDKETADLYAWYQAEVKRRGMKVAA